MKDIKYNSSSGNFLCRVSGIIEIDGKYLLHKLNTDDFWALVGGKVQIFEESKTAIKREVYEELGWTIDSVELILTTENFFKYNNKNFHELGFVYKLKSKTSLKTVENEFKGLDDPRIVYKWFTIDEIRHINLKPTFIKEKILQQNFDRQHIVHNEALVSQEFRRN